jgi:shikimate kinase
MKTGQGAAHGAITILNATAAGVGCSLAIEGGAGATWTWTRQPGLHADLGGADERLVRAIFASAPPPPGFEGANVFVRTRHPPSRGLKTSSSAAAAMLRARAASLGRPLDGLALVHEAVACSRAASVTLTGAMDDQTAVVMGGCHLTDNRRDTVLQSMETEPLEVAVWVPAAGISKAEVARVDLGPIRGAASLLASRLRRGDVAGVLTENGRLFSRCYEAAGLPVSEEPARVALAAGALGAGLSGTGPAVAALFRRRCELPPVTGGHWSWSRAVAASAPPVGLPATPQTGAMS